MCVHARFYVRNRRCAVYHGGDHVHEIRVPQGVHFEIQVDAPSSAKMFVGDRTISVPADGWVRSIDGQPLVLGAGGQMSVAFMWPDEEAERFELKSVADTRIMYDDAPNMEWQRPVQVPAGRFGSKSVVVVLVDALIAVVSIPFTLNRGSDGDDKDRERRRETYKTGDTGVRPRVRIVDDPEIPQREPVRRPYETPYPSRVPVREDQREGVATPVAEGHTLREKPEVERKREGSSTTGDRDRSRQEPEIKIGGTSGTQSPIRVPERKLVPAGAA
jgi:hypothetical protein